MPGEYQYIDIETIIKCKIFNDLILRKDNQNALFLVYVVHNCKHVFLYEILRGSEIKLADFINLREIIDLEDFRQKVTSDSFLVWGRELETVVEYNNLFIGIISTEHSRESKLKIDSINWGEWELSVDSDSDSWDVDQILLGVQ